VLSVRGGQAGFFSDEEMAASGGVLWDASKDKPGPQTRYRPPPHPSRRHRFSAADLDRLAEGDAVGCFGPGFEHITRPGIANGRLRLIDSVPTFEPTGGPWQRGYLCAETTVPVDAWFYQGHFHNDPVMPGSLMVEAAIQALGVTMMAMGMVTGGDGWRFEPALEVDQTFVCRRQVIPDQVHRLEYEVFVEEIVEGPKPIMFAALLCRSDGIKIFHCRRFGLQLVPG
jgi:3-hydroxymyristoyl/3-hydroxydecanoyl-(acyl carrier protein) dehydratase